MESEHRYKGHPEERLVWSETYARVAAALVGKVQPDEVAKVAAEHAANAVTEFEKRFT